MIILVTRPEQDQQQTRDGLRAIEAQALACPLMDRVRLPVGIPDRNWQGLIVTSRNGLRILSDEELERLRPLPLFCVGGRTRALAEMLGFGHIVAVAPTVSALATMMEAQIAPDAGPLLYLSAKHRSGDLAAQLEKYGLEVCLVALYDMVARERLSEEVVAAVQEHRLDGVLLYSKRSAQILLALLAQHDLEEAMQRVVIYCLSSQVAEAVSGHGYQICVSEAPDEATLLACVKKHHSSLI